MSEDNLLGVQLDEYRLEAFLSRGGMARIYRALDTGLNRYVAVKVIDTPYRSDLEYSKRFKIEAQALARLDHPHVVHLFRYGEVNGMLYMAMQFIEGTDLGFILNSYRRDEEFISSKDALRLVNEMCQALDYVHIHGIIHRDVKSSNIMLTRDEGRAILTDFGLALRAEVGTRGEVFGSPHYIAPEQAISSARAVPQSDLYSLGVILYEMFTGVLPFDAADPMDIAIQHMNTPPPLPREVRPDLSLEVEAVLMKALEKKPEDRYQTGKALAMALERALRKQPETIPPTLRTIPEQVTIGLVANPLGALPPIPAVRTPSKLVAETETDPLLAPNEVSIPSATGELPPAPAKTGPAEQPQAVQDRSYPPILTPKKANRKPSFWILVSMLALTGLCIFTCLVVGGLTFLLRGVNQITGITQETLEPNATFRNTLPPTGRNTPSPTAQENFRLKFWHCEDEGCLIVENTGRVSFPITDLNLKGKESSLSGGEWGTPSLQPGQCVKVVKDEKSGRKLPDEVTCQLVGQPLVRDGKERFWINGFTIYYQEHKVADCLNKGDWCEVLVKR